MFRSDFFEYLINLDQDKERFVYFVSGASEELVRSSVLSGQRPDFIQIPKDCPMFLTKMMTRCWHQKPTQRPEFKGSVNLPVSCYVKI